MIYRRMSSGFGRGGALTVLIVVVLAACPSSKTGFEPLSDGEISVRWRAESPDPTRAALDLTIPIPGGCIEFVRADVREDTQAVAIRAVVREVSREGRVCALVGRQVSHSVVLDAPLGERPLVAAPFEDLPGTPRFVDD